MSKDGECLRTAFSTGISVRFDAITRRPTNPLRTAVLAFQRMYDHSTGELPSELENPGHSHESGNERRNTAVVTAGATV